MIDYTSLETAIVTALAPLRSANIDVMAWPELEIEFAKPFADSRLTVVYHSSEYGGPISANQVNSDETVSMQIMIEARTLRKPFGIYQLKAAVLEKLVGLQVPNWTKLIPAKFDMSERSEKGGVWCYNLVMKTKAVSQQEVNDDLPIYASLTSISATYGVQ